MSVTLTMIVRDEASNLAACLAPVAELFDEVIVVDTGSTDATRDIARGFGARVIDVRGATTSPRPETPRSHTLTVTGSSGSTPMTAFRTAAGRSSPRSSTPSARRTQAIT